MITKEQIEKFWGTPEQWKELCLAVLKQGEELQELTKANAQIKELLQRTRV